MVKKLLLFLGHRRCLGLRTYYISNANFCNLQNSFTKNKTKNKLFWVVLIQTYKKKHVKISKSFWADFFMNMNDDFFLQIWSDIHSYHIRNSDYYNRTRNKKILNFTDQAVRIKPGPILWNSLNDHFKNVNSNKQKTKQNKTKQKTKQNKTKQNKKQTNKQTK